MKMALTFAAILAASATGSFAQVAPAATSGGANLSYSLRYSQNSTFGGPMGNWQTATPSWSLGYVNGRSDRPFRLSYSGGYSWTLQGPGYASGVFQRMDISEGWNWRTWNLNVSDDINYAPQSPTTGFSGIPGIGEPIGVPAPPSDVTIQQLGAHMVTNTTTAQMGHILNYTLSLNFGGASTIMRFVSSNGLNTDTQNGNAGLTYRLNGRSSATAQYSYMHFAYPDYDYSFQVNSANFSYQRSWNRALSTSASIGPSWVGSAQTSSQPQPPTPSQIPPPSQGGMSASTLVNASASLSYALRSGTASISYTRGTSGGSGYLFGAISDSVVGTFSRRSQKDFTLEFSGGYRRTSGLGSLGTYDGEFGGVQASRKFGRFLSAFANYTATTQSSNTAVPNNVLDSLMHTLSFGIGYSRETNPVR